MMTDQQRAHLEGRLLKERDRVSRALERLDEASASVEDGDLTSYPLHMADQGTDAMEQEKSLVLLGAQGGLLADINEALHRLYKEPERYGRCERCGADIPVERLDVVPWARTCVACQNQDENGERGA